MTETKQFKTFDGTVHPVTAAWYAEHIESHPGIENLDEEAIQAAVKKIIALGAVRAVTTEEVKYLRSLDAVASLNKAVAMLQGVDYQVEYGFDGADQVHFNSQTLACGCVCHVVFDHHKALANQQCDQHAHAPLRCCATHMHLKDDWASHRDVALADHAARMIEASESGEGSV